uniref:Uncharacterized protein n=1 Tax=Neobodo designis TaxID=312471 RepID=A0A7S1M262_NEODS
MEDQGPELQAKEELRNEFGELTDSDDDDETRQLAFSRHRKTLSEHDRRQSASASMRFAERRELRDTIDRLVLELEAVKAANVSLSAGKSEVEAELHEAKLQRIAAIEDAETARHEASLARDRLIEVTRHRDQLSNVLELRVAAQKRRQRAARELLLWAEAHGRNLLMDSYADFVSLLTFSAECSPRQKRPPAFSTQYAMLEAMERMRRADIYSAETREMHRLVSQWTHLAHMAFDSQRNAMQPFRTPRSSSAATGDGTSNRKASPALSRPWYPPGPTHARPGSGQSSTRRSLSRVAKGSSPRRSRTPPTQLHSTVANMHNLLAQLSSWSEGHSP